MDTTPEVAASSAIPARPRADVLRRADGIELIGEFEDSGFSSRRSSRAGPTARWSSSPSCCTPSPTAADGQRDIHDIGGVVERALRPAGHADNVAHLVDRQLRPLGVLALADGTMPELEKREPLMALRHRRPLLPSGAVNAAPARSPGCTGRS